jgi:hypothetical protein
MIHQMSNSTPEQTILAIFALFTGLPASYQSLVLDKLHELSETGTIWDVDSESQEIEVEIIDADEDDQLSG